MQNKISITKPSISELEIEYVNDAIRNGWGPKCYDYINKFEKSFPEYIGSKFGLATSSCTGAIHLALMAMGIKSGDEVIVPDSTWIASVEPILYIGAKPVFVDVLEDTWCIDPIEIERAITNKTTAIIPVHLYGNVCEMDEIMEIATKYKLKVLEDAAEGLGSEYKGKKCGSIGDAGVFSFHGTKTMSTGEGGIICTNNKEIYSKASILNDHGRDPKIGKTFWMENYGYKYKMSNLQAAMGCAQVKRLEELVAHKRLVFSWYKEGFKNIKGIQINEEQDYAINSYWMPTLVFDDTINLNRDELINFLSSSNIDSRPFFYPLSLLPMFNDQPENTIAYKIGVKGINLPSHNDLKKSGVEYIVKQIINFLNISN